MRTLRPLARTRRAAATFLIAAVGLLSLAGCDPRTLLYFLQPFEPMLPPKAKDLSLKDKKVVILTHAVTGSTSDMQSIDRELPREVGRILRENGKKIEVVNFDKIADWMENHPSWTDPSEAAREFDADIAIFLEVEQFQVASSSSPGVLEGKSRTHIQVFEMEYPKDSKDKPLKDQPKESRVVYDDYADSEFPRRGPIEEGSRLSRSTFRNKFVRVVAMEITWHFLEHSPEEDIEDVTFGAR